MKNKNWMFIIFPLMSVLIAIIIFWGLASGEKNEKALIAVIVDDNNSDRWKVCKQGLENAASEAGVDINFVTMDIRMSEAEKISMISRELDNGADGLILNIAVAGTMADYLDITAQSVPIVFMEAAADTSFFHTVVGTDQYGMGKELGNILTEQVMNKECRVGILLGEGKREACLERESGLLEILSDKDNIEVVWSIQDSVFPLETELNNYVQEEPVDYLITLENGAAEAAADYKETENSEVRIIAVGNTEKNLHHVDKGIIHTLIVPDEFKIGYFSLHAVFAQITAAAGSQKEGNVTAIENQVDYFIINKENLFNEETQYLLFPKVR